MFNVLQTLTHDLGHKSMFKFAQQETKEESSLQLITVQSVAFSFGNKGYIKLVQESYGH